MLVEPTVSAVSADLVTDQTPADSVNRGGALNQLSHRRIKHREHSTGSTGSRCSHVPSRYMVPAQMPWVGRKLFSRGLKPATGGGKIRWRSACHRAQAEGKRVVMRGLSCSNRAWDHAESGS